jgi:hypothetical protein
MTRGNGVVDVGVGKVVCERDDGERTGMEDWGLF